jgi:hypothetical protein
MAFATACVWLIEAATLGLFLQLLVWLITALLAVAASQYIVHPTVTLRTVRSQARSALTLCRLWLI